MSPRWDLHQHGRIFIIPLGSSSFCWDYHHPAGIFIIPLGSSHPARTIIIIIQLRSLSPLWDLHHHHPAGFFTIPLGSSSSSPRWNLHHPSGIFIPPSGTFIIITPPGCHPAAATAEVTARIPCPALDPEKEERKKERFLPERREVGTCPEMEMEPGKGLSLG